jgi:4-amino-4-deoxy-L-arabinose transferase-like glycosyltransferase
VTEKSPTFDETIHTFGGYTYWRFNDYRVMPENGNLPMRLYGLALLLDRDRLALPSRDQDAWARSRQWILSRQFFFELGNDFRRMILVARAAAALVSVGVLLVIFLWSRRLFGPAGGVLSLLLAAVSPSLLAHGRITSSDLMPTLLFTLSAGCFWRVAHRVNAWTLSGSALSTGLLLVAKFSGLLFLPMAVILTAIRLAGNRPMVVSVGRRSRTLVTRRSQALLLAGVLAVHAIVGVTVIWGSFGFRYAAMKDRRPAGEAFHDPWEFLLREPGAATSLIRTAQASRLLPEAYLYGLASTVAKADRRPAFLNGDHRLEGWWYFFPYCVLVKTPLGLFVVLLLAGAAITRRRRGVWRAGPDAEIARGPPASRRTLAYATAPLWVVLIVYWVSAISSNLNIGLRHVLPTYPPMFILAGAAAAWFAPRPRLAALAVAAASAWVVASSFAIRPHYLAYFNALVGPRDAHKHLVDSSLDWGQDLPGLAAWLERMGLNRGWRKRIEGEPFREWLERRGRDPAPHLEPGSRVYLAYFGTASPSAYGIRARTVVDYFDFTALAGAAPDRERLRPLEGGTYCISATLLQCVYTEPMDRWRPRHERRYAEYRRAVEAYLASASPDTPRAGRPMNPRRAEAIERFLALRAGRLCAWLRQREPDAMIGYSILIYQLTDADVREALFGPPAELLPDREGSR